MNKTIRKIGIIGASGFVGTRLVNRLILGKYNFHCFDIKLSHLKVQQSKMHVNNLNSNIDIHGCNTLINLAAEHRDDVKPLSRYYDVNVQGAINVCNLARSADIKHIVFTSSVAIFGFAPSNTDETGEANYFNEYGKTKFEAEQIYKEWQAEDPYRRTLVIVRPTVIFGEGNRGNVYNLFKQIASRKFIMIGDGYNKKSMAYVENVAAFLEHTLSFKPGLHIYNYVDKPDFDMNTLVSQVRKTLFGKNNVGIRLPSFIGVVIGHIADFVARLSGRTLPISTIRIKKFMGTTQFESSVSKTGFIPPVNLDEGLDRTLCYEFLENNSDKKTFETE